MRPLLLVIGLLFASPALAQYWGQYENARFGYSIDIPPDFIANGESDNGDGQAFYNLVAEQGLRVWGGILSDSLESQAISEADALTTAGWSLSEQSSTPDWAMVMAMRDHRVLFQRTILLCDKESFAAARVEFNIRDLNAMGPVLDGVSRSFVPVGC